MLLTRRRQRHLRFRHDAFRKIVAGDQSASDEELARFLDILPSHYTRIRTGRTRPSPGFIAAVVAALPNVAFLDLFEIYDVDAS